MDGTLTRAIHDFDAIRHALGIEPGRPILEALDSMAEPEATLKRQLLNDIEFELARMAQPNPGAAELLTGLAQRRVPVGLLTRNNGTNVIETLRATGLLEFFEPEHLYTRDNCTPKPDPDGLLKLCSRFGYPPGTVAMVGDYRYDLECGRRAGTVTVHYAGEETQRWPDLTDHFVLSLEELCERCLPAESMSRSLANDGNRRAPF